MQNRKIISATFMLLCTAILLSACGGNGPLAFLATETPAPTNTPLPPTATPTPAPVLSISGSIGEAGERKIALCQVAEGTLELPADCVLRDQVVISDDNGTFEFFDVPAASYFLLYDMNDQQAFDAGMQQWQGQTLRMGDFDWLENEFFGPDHNITAIAPVGTPLSFMQNPQYLLAYNYLVLHGDGPFALAHTPRLLATGRIIDMIHPVVAVIQAGQTTEVSIHAYK